MSSELKEIFDIILKFRDERLWGQFHDGRNLAMCLNIESSELLELFLWKEENEVNQQDIKLELADVFYTAFLLAHRYNLDIKEIISNKIKLNEQKYPIDKSTGSNKKYNQL